MKMLQLYEYNKKPLKGTLKIDGLYEMWIISLIKLFLKKKSEWEMKKEKIDNFFCKNPLQKFCFEREKLKGHIESKGIFF